MHRIESEGVRRATLLLQVVRAIEARGKSRFSVARRSVGHGSQRINDRNARPRRASGRRPDERRQGHRSQQLRSNARESSPNKIPHGRTSTSERHDRRATIDHAWWRLERKADRSHCVRTRGRNKRRFRR
jgi:hypothetical protein